jgi:aldose 1-epimerase
MFFIETQDFGSVRKLVAWNSSGLRLEVLPDNGAALNAFYIPTRDGCYLNVIDGCVLESDLEETSSAYKGVFLFPFPNRLQDGKWNWEGKVYSFPVNEPDRNNSLHGLLHNRKFDVVEISATSEMALIHLTCSSSLPDSAFPFHYQIDVEFIVTDNEGLAVKTQVTNLGTSIMPFGFGWHPYFSSGSKLDDLIVSFPDVVALEVDQRMIPTGNKMPYHVFDSPQHFGKTVLDTGFKLNPCDVYRIQILDPAQKLKFSIWQEVGVDGYRYVQIYTHPDRKSLAIEPMTCIANALQTLQDGIQFLEPGSSHRIDWGISFR